MEASGGIHVIQTFMSEEESEEVQIMGRTARQGTKGSFSMILSEEDLQVLEVTPQEIIAARQEGKLYTRLHEKRLAYFDKTFDEKMKDIDAIMDNHVGSQEFLRNIADGETAEALRYMTRFYTVNCHF